MFFYTCGYTKIYSIKVQGSGSIKAHSIELAGWEAIMLGGGTTRIE